MNHEGISPEDAERLLVKPMEREQKSVEGVKEMRSAAYLGGGYVMLEFEADLILIKQLTISEQKWTSQKVSYQTTQTSQK